MPRRLPNPPYKIENRGYITPCWIWLGCQRKGYGLVSNPNYKGIGAKMMSAHVWMYEKVKGIVENRSRTFVPNHLCKIKLCINPEHIEWVDNATNVARGKISILEEQKKYNIIPKDTIRHYCDKCSNFYLTIEALVVHKEKEHI
jgi:hypothetical protein